MELKKGRWERKRNKTRKQRWESKGLYRFSQKVITEGYF